MALSGAYNCCLEDGVHYAAASMSGRHKSFHRVDPRSLRLCKREEALCTWPLRSISERARRANGRRVDLY